MIHGQDYGWGSVANINASKTTYKDMTSMKASAPGQLTPSGQQIADCVQLVMRCVGSWTKLLVTNYLQSANAASKSSDLGLNKGKFLHHHDTFMF